VATTSKVADPSVQLPDVSAPSDAPAAPAVVTAAAPPSVPSAGALSTTFTPDLTLERVRHLLATFAAERDWDQYHQPRNLSVTEQRPLCACVRVRVRVDAPASSCSLLVLCLRMCVVLMSMSVSLSLKWSLLA
jgi:hypothetical protein